MLARPLGALVFGYIGDAYGRERALFYHLSRMAVSLDALPSLQPTLQAGLFAPLLFCLGKALQNFFAAGEIMGGAIYMLENGSSRRQDLLSSLFSASTMGGYLLASIGVYLLLLTHLFRWIRLALSLPLRKCNSARGVPFSTQTSCYRCYGHLQGKYNKTAPDTMEKPSRLYHHLH